MEPDLINSLVDAANNAEKLGIVGLMFLINAVAVSVSVMMYREVKKCRADIVALLRDDIYRQRGK